MFSPNSADSLINCTGNTVIRHRKVAQSLDSKILFFHLFLLILT